MYQSKTVEGKKIRGRNLLVLSIFLFVGWGAAAEQAKGALLVDIQDTFVLKSILCLITPAVSIEFNFRGLKRIIHGVRPYIKQPKKATQRPIRHQSGPQPF